MNSIDVMKCRLVKESEIKYNENITSPKNADALFRNFGMADSADEVFSIACLAADGSVTGIHEVSHGDLTISVVSPREVMKRALLNNASCLVLGHNHPSGRLEPSEEDRKVTERLKEAGNIMGISITDHIIISSSGYFSFRENGMI